jgi:DNA repair exonuclease SbcCD ATPase subunit
MKRTRAEMKAEMMTQAELMIDELLDWNEQTSEPTLTQIEDVILKLRKRLSEQLAVRVIQVQETTRPVPSPACPTCGREMHYKGVKHNAVESRVGCLDLERGYYYCKTCQAGLFPPGSTA